MEKTLNLSANENQIKSHIPVLVREVVENCFKSDGKVWVDVTFGFGGHTKALLGKYPQIEYIIAIDRDPEILKYCSHWFIREYGAKRKIIFVNESYSKLDKVLIGLGIKQVDGIFADLGMANFHTASANRGFSFNKLGPLDMRYNQTENIPTAYDLIHTLSEQELTEIFSKFGEERFSRTIAKAIIKRRQNAPIKTTLELAQIVEAAIPSWCKARCSIHPATRVFQALRIAVNNELDELEKFMKNSISFLAPFARISVITFHSLEDKTVKNAYQMAAKSCQCPSQLPECTCSRKPLVKIITPKPITPTCSEVQANPRSRSAKLRIAEKLP